ncbi:hypothetical protein B0H14DRAFT_2806294 [Mycena olivaceomarginata]|nr:hypothetical protein B0H14DRAFT_2806294 [Mycena olivaceomarginata]
MPSTTPIEGLEVRRASHIRSQKHARTAPAPPPSAVLQRTFTTAPTQISAEQTRRRDARSHGEGLGMCPARAASAYERLRDPVSGRGEVMSFCGRLTQSPPLQIHASLCNRCRQHPPRLGSIRLSTTFNSSTEAPPSSGRLDSCDSCPARSTPLLDCGMQARRCRSRMLRRKAQEALWSMG